MVVEIKYLMDGLKSKIMLPEGRIHERENAYKEITKNLKIRWRTYKRYSDVERRE